MEFIKTVEKLRDLAYDISTNYNVEESLKDFRKILEQAKNDGIDLNTEVTEARYENNNCYLFEGNLSQNLGELYWGNWNGRRYIGPIIDDYIYSTTAYYLITNEENDKVLDIIDEVYPNFKALDKESITLSIQDLFDKKGYFKVGILNERYLITKKEEENFENWIEKFEDVENEEELKAEYKLSTVDILTGKTVYFKIKADQYETYVNWNDLGFLKMEMVK